MLLVVDAGNTNVVFAVHDRDSWRGIWRIATDPQRTSDEYAVWLLSLLTHSGLKPAEINAAVIGTVVPAVAEGEGGKGSAPDGDRLEVARGEVVADKTQIEVRQVAQL